MSCECPVIASNTSSIPEVVGDAALSFDPTSVDDTRDVAKNFLLPQAQIRMSTLYAKSGDRTSFDEMIGNPKIRTSLARTRKSLVQAGSVPESDVAADVSGVVLFNALEARAEKERL